MSQHRSHLRDAVVAIGATSPGHIYDLAEFLAAGACTPEIARRRFRYEPDDAAEALVGMLHDRKLIDPQLRPADPLVEITATILQWRADSAARLWTSDLVTATRLSAEALSRASGPMVEAFRSLPTPAADGHRLHHVLTGLRYARLDAHMDAWEEAGLTAAEVVALSSAVESIPVPTGPERLVAKGWLRADGSATAEGQAARSVIEADTDARCDGLFGKVTDRERLLESLRSLPPHGA